MLNARPSVSRLERIPGIEFSLWRPFVEKASDRALHHRPHAVGVARRELASESVAEQPVRIGRQRDHLLFGEASPRCAVRPEIVDDPLIAGAQLVVLAEQLANGGILVNEITDVRFGDPRMPGPRFGDVAHRVCCKIGIFHRQMRQVEFRKRLHVVLLKSAGRVGRRPARDSKVPRSI